MVEETSLTRYRGYKLVDGKGEQIGRTRITPYEAQEECPNFYADYNAAWLIFRAMSTCLNERGVVFVQELRKLCAQPYAIEYHPDSLALTIFDLTRLTPQHICKAALAAFGIKL